MGEQEYVIPKECTEYISSANLSLPQIYKWANENQEKRAVYSKSPEVIAKDFYDSSFAGFYKNGKFDSQKFIEYLKSVKRISDFGPDFKSMTENVDIFTSIGHSPLLISTEDLDDKFDKTFLASNQELEVYTTTMQGFLDFMIFDNVSSKLLSQAMAQFENISVDTVIPDYREAYHSLGGVFIPTCNLAINKSTENLPLAQEFILTALEAPVQNKILTNGFPIRKDCYQRDFWLQFNYSIKLVSEENEFYKEFTWPLPLSMNMLMNMIETLDCSMPKNQVLKESILEISQIYFQGKDSAENVAKKVEILFAQAAF